MIINDYLEVSIDGMSGLTHSFLGLSHGNLASMTNKNYVSYPRKACLEGLKKMKLVHDLGVPQYILPPHPRPFLNPNESIDHLLSLNNPELLYRFSSSSMWLANSAHVTGSLDSSDGKIYVTPSNLFSTKHRKFESIYHSELLKLLLPHASHFPIISDYTDEGSANTCLLSPSVNQQGLHLFFYNKDNNNIKYKDGEFPKRQDKQCYDILRNSHKLTSNYILEIQQLEESTNSGVFHNDVISTATESVFLCHELTCSQDDLLQIQNQYFDLCGEPLHYIEISNTLLPLPIAVQSYLFNSQIFRLNSNEMVILVPERCLNFTESRNTIRYIIESKNPISKVYFTPLSQSMNNGGGPACLRLRLRLNKSERDSIPEAFKFSNEKFHTLCSFVKQHYPKELDSDSFKSSKWVHSILNCYENLYDLFHLTFTNDSISFK